MSVLLSLVRRRSPRKGVWKAACRRRRIADRGRAVVEAAPVPCRRLPARPALWTEMAMLLLGAAGQVAQQGVELLAAQLQGLDTQRYVRR